MTPRTYTVRLTKVVRVHQSEDAPEIGWAICGAYLYRDGALVGLIISQVWEVGEPLAVTYSALLVESVVEHTEAGAAA